MVRNRPRLTKKANWTQEEMAAAITAVREHEKRLREAARFYNIPVMTLRGILKANDCSEAQLRRKPTFTKEQENKISQQVLTLAKVFYGLTPTELRRLVFEYAEANKIKHNFNTTSKLAGYWLQGFLKRNPSVSVRKPEANSLNRISAFNINEVKQFYSNLESVMDKYGFSPSNIYNFDETGISTVQEPGHILGPKGVKHVGSATIWERGKNITICCAFNAAGTYIPPMFIYPRLRMSPLLQKDGPINAIYQCSKNGWINEELFLVWLDHFIVYSKPTKQSPVLLIMDSHTNHTTLAAYNKCKDNNIVVLTIPPHTSHRLQPLDITFYSSLKASFSRECDSFMKANAFNKITPCDIASLFNKAYSRVASIKKGISGFKTTGIFPLDTERFSEDDFAMLTPAGLELVSVVKESTHVVEEAASSPVQLTYQILDTESSTSRQNSHMSNDNNKTSNRKKIPNVDSAIHVPFKDISPLPSSKSNANSKPTRKQHSTIFTLTPNKINLELAALEKEEKKVKKMENIIKKDSKKLKPKGKSRYRKTDSKILKPTHDAAKTKKKLCRRNISFSSSENEHWNELLLCDDNEMDDQEPLNFEYSSAIPSTDLPNTSSICQLCGNLGETKNCGLGAFPVPVGSMLSAALLILQKTSFVTIAKCRKYAMLKLKVILSTILRNFRVAGGKKQSDWQLQADIILKRTDGFNIKLEPRKKPEYTTVP